MKSKLQKALLITTIAVLALCLAGCGENQLDKANKLLEEGSYQEALDIYSALDDQESVVAQVSQCKYFLLVNYIRDKGTITKDYSSESATVKIEARESGDIKLTFSNDFGSNGGKMGTTLATTISYGNTEAPIQGNYDFNLMGVYQQEKAEGILDLGTYRYGQNISWDSYDTSGSTIQGTATKPGLNFLSDVADETKTMIRGLHAVTQESGTDVSLSDIGFKNL